MRHFLQETDYAAHELPRIFEMARFYKRSRGRHAPRPLEGQTWALIFSKSSTRTRVSFEVGIRELGGAALFLGRQDLQLGRGESIADTARVLSRYVHGLVVRTFDHADVEALARHGSRPVVNALTDLLHPCQIYTDAFTVAERWAGPDGDLVASLRGRRVVFYGDTANNVALSWILGAHHFGMEIVLCGPPEDDPGPKVDPLLRAAGYTPAYRLEPDPITAARGADVLYTDVWVSMGQEAEQAGRLERMRPYAVTSEVLAAAKPEVWFLHCLPAHPGEEVSEAVLADPRSIIFDQAENRLHLQKAILSDLAEHARGL